MGIVVVGSINADLSVTVDRHPRPGETLLGAGGDISAGGKGANQAVAAARLGANVALVGAVGRDPYAGPATEHLRASGTDLSAVAETDEVTGLAVITVDARGENTIVVVPGANATVGAEYVAQHAELIGDADVVLLQGEVPADGFAEAVRLARGRVVVNLAPVIEVDAATLLKADPLMANEHEAGLILAQLGVDTVSSEPRALAKALLDAGFPSVVLTIGAQGALVATGEELVQIPTPKVGAISTVGAGDAFAGAFCHRIVAGDGLVDAAKYAARVGAFSVTRKGAQNSYPTAGDMLPEV